MHPSISFIIPTYNGKELVKKCLDSIFSLEYDGKIEVIIMDGGSTDGNLELVKKYPVRLYHNKKRFPEGKGMGKDQAFRLAKNEIVAFVDQDNELIGKDWLKEMVKPFLNEKDLAGVACKLYVDKKDSLTNQYLSLIGTDPFAVYRSLEGKLGLNKIDLIDGGDYFLYKYDANDYLCAGGNCFLYLRKDLKKIGGYSQDVEVIYKLAKKGLNKIAIPKLPRTHHKTINSFISFLIKRFKWGWHYAFRNISNREYSWMPKSFREWGFLTCYILENLLIIPNLFVAIRRYIKTGEKAWILHPFAMFFVTLFYCIIGVISKLRN